MTDDELIQYLTTVQIEDVKYSVLKLAANRLAALKEEIRINTATITFQEDLIQKQHTENKKLTTEVERLRAAIREHIDWWYKPTEYMHHSEKAYQKLSESIKETKEASNESK